MAELWGVDNQKEIEKYHDTFCTHLLRAPKTTSRIMI